MRQFLQNETENSFKKNLLQIVTEVYYKVRQVIQSVSGITKCDRLLLQSASGITKCDRLLLQSTSGIAKCDSYYKVRRNSSAKLIHVCTKLPLALDCRQSKYSQ